MKKIIVLLISVIFISGVLLVSMFGMNLPSFTEKIPVQRIELLGEGIRYDKEDGIYVRNIRYNPATPEANGFQLSWAMYPADATNKRARFSFPYLPEDQTHVEVSSFGAITIKKPIYSFVVRISATDGSNKYVELTIDVD